MNSDFFKAFDELEREKHISKEFLITELERSLTKAYEEEFHTQGDIKVVANEKKKDIKVYRIRTVVADLAVPYDPIKQIKLSEARQIKKRSKVGEEFLEELKMKTFSYLAVSKAKGMMTQAIKEYLKKQNRFEAGKRNEEIVTGEVVNINDDGSIVVNVPFGYKRVDAIDLIPNQTYTIGQKLKFFVVLVNSEGKEQEVVLSRTHKKLLMRLFELEVPEIQRGEVFIRNVAREPGSRAKMSVEARNGVQLDPVGTCIGEYHSRVEAVSNELNGEKIDIIPYSDSLEKYVNVALSPALVKKVEKVEEKRYRASVLSDQYSLAIGKEGQNVRLAGKLTGVKIDIAMVD